MSNYASLALFRNYLSLYFIKDQCSDKKLIAKAKKACLYKFTHLFDITLGIAHKWLCICNALTVNMLVPKHSGEKK